MTHQKPLLLLALVMYIFSPTLYSWISNPQGVWYKPFIIWVIVIVVAFVWQKSKHREIVDSAVSSEETRLK